jgi:hypothetical protein
VIRDARRRVLGAEYDDVLILEPNLPSRKEGEPLSSQSWVRGRGLPHGVQAQVIR